MKRGATRYYITLALFLVTMLAIGGAALWTANLDLATGAWLSVMIRQYGVQLLFTVARVIGFVLMLGLTVVVVNWRRDRDEKRNVDEKARRIIEAKIADRDYWKRRAMDAEALAGDRLAIIRVVTAGIGRAAVQLRGAGDAETEPQKLRKVQG